MYISFILNWYSRRNLHDEFMSAWNFCFMFPGQPVNDLESYMTSLEKKQESVRTMVEKLRPITGDPATKFFGIAYAVQGTWLPHYTPHISPDCTIGCEKLWKLCWSRWKPVMQPWVPRSLNSRWTIGMGNLPATD